MSCKFCGEEIVNRNLNAIYCSAECKWKARNLRVSKKRKENKKQIVNLSECAFCGIEYNKNRSWQTTCSRSCYNKMWSIQNKDKRTIYHKEYEDNKRDKDRRKVLEKVRYVKNKDRINNARREKRKIDISIKIIDNLRRRVNSVLRSNNKSNSTIKLIGCNLSFLKSYIEGQFANGMTWENYGDYWHIDHIIPVRYFKENGDITNAATQQKAFNYRNLRPLEAIKNLSKNDKFDLNLIDKYKIKDLLLEGE